MDSNALSNREAAEYIKLLRRASGTRLVLLAFWAVATWGLWVAIQAGDQKTLPIDKTYDERLVELKKKWNVSVESPFGFFSTDTDVTSALLQEKNGWYKNIMQVIQFEGELGALRNEYFLELERAYIVHVKVPYLQENVEVNGVTLANWWPFGLIAVVAAALVLSMRERVNAIVVAWIGHNRDVRSFKSGLVIQSDFLVGSLSDGVIRDIPCKVYRKPLMVQPESLILFALICATVYMSLSFGFFENPANSHEMESTFDYTGGVWFCIVAIGILVWLTRRRYAERLEQYTGIPILGRVPEIFERVVGSRWRSYRKRLDTIPWVRKASQMSEAVIIFLAGLCLCLPWMNPNHIRGYRLFLAEAPAPLDSDFYFELQVQLYIAILFIIFCLTDWFARTKLQPKLYKILSGVRRFLGFATITLLGNLVFHFVMLQMLVEAQAEKTWLLLPVNYLARPHPVMNSSLVWTDPSYGFWIFLLICLLLVWTG